MPRTADEGRQAEARRLAAQQPRPTTREIAAQLGTDPRTVQRWLGDGNAPRGPRPDPAVTDEHIIGLRDRDDLTWAGIARQLGMSETGARNRYRAAKGIPRPDRATPSPPA